MLIDPWESPMENPSPISRKTIEDFLEFKKKKS